MEVPELRWAKRGDVELCYQLFGSGPVCKLVLAEWPATSASVWEHPGHLRHWRRKAGYGPTLRLDYSGLGQSSPLPLERVGAVDELVADAVAVLDAAGFERVVVEPEGYLCHAAITMAVHHADRVERLVLANPFVRLTRSSDHPLGIEPDQVELVVETVARTWGTGELIGATPGLGVRGSYLDFCARFERSACTAETAAAVTRRMLHSDIGPLLASVALPTYVFHSGDLPFNTAADSAELAARIAGAEYEQWVDESFYGSIFGRQHERYERFLGVPEPIGTPATVTLLFVDVVASTERAALLGDSSWRQLLEDIDVVLEREVSRRGGRVVTRTGDGCLAAFDAPASSVAAALGILKSGGVLGVQLRAGMHTGAVELRQDGDVAGLTVHIAARVTALAGPGQVLVTEATAATIDSQLTAAGEHNLKGVPGRWALFDVTT